MSVLDKLKENKEREKKRLDTLIAYRTVFGTTTGELVLEDLISTYMMRSSMGKDLHETAFKEGERNVVLKILTALNIKESDIRERVNNVNKT